MPSNKNTISAAEQSFANGPEPTRGGRWTSTLTFDQTCQLVGKSFAGTMETPGEPTVEWMLEHVKFASQQERIDVVTFFMSFFINENMGKHAKVFAKDLGNGDFAGAAIVREYNPNKAESRWSAVGDKLREGVHIINSIVSGKVPSYIKDRKDEEKKRVTELLKKAGDDSMAAMKVGHKQYGPQEKHWYVAVVATDPDHQGKGQGSELMRRISALADEAKMDCYLEAGNEKNMKFYKKFGYEVVHTVQLETELQNRPLTMYQMVRRHQ